MGIDTTTQRSRRAFLAGTTGGLAAIVAQAMARPLGVQAAATSVFYINDENDDTVVSAHSFRQPGFPYSGDGTAILGSSYDNVGIKGLSHSSSGVSGSSNLGVGVAGASDSNYGVQGTSAGAGVPSIIGRKTVEGVAVQGEIDLPGSGWTAVHGITNGAGPGVVGDNTGTGRGVWGRTTASSEGVYGEAINGRGGRFKGKKAQIKLDPSADATHPASGARGDFFVDRSGRLWYCKGGAAWSRLA